MAEKNERKADMWVDTKVELIDEFQKEEFKKLLEYAKQNEHNILRLLYNENTEELSQGLKFGSSKLKYFEYAISEDEKLLAVFKLGELYGTVGCLSNIRYEKHHDLLALAKLQIVTNHFPKLKNETEDILIFIDNKGSATEKQLISVVKIGLFDLIQILNILLREGFIHYPSEGYGYSLSDWGIRAVKQIKKV